MASGTDPSETAEASEAYQERLQESLQCLEGGFLEPARLALQEAVGLDPSRPEAFNLLGVVAELSSQHDQAQRYFRAALALDPGFDAARTNLNRTSSSADLSLGPAALPSPYRSPATIAQCAAKGPWSRSLQRMLPTSLSSSLPRALSRLTWAAPRR